MRARHRPIVSMLVGLGAALCLCACGNNSVTAPDEDYHAPVIWPEPFIVTEADSLSLVQIDDSLLVFDVVGSPPRISPGQVIAGAEGGGYLRKDVSAQIRGRRLSIKTAPAHLTDVVVIGAVDTVMEIGFGSFSGASEMSAPTALNGTAQGAAATLDRIELAPGVSLSGSGINLSGTVLYSGDVGGAQLTVAIPHGRIEFNPELTVAVKIYGGWVRDYEVVTSGQIDLTFDATIESSDSIALDHEVPIASLTRRFVEHIGGVPVVETVTITYAAGFSIRKGFAGSSSLGVDGSGMLTGGARYRNFVWTSVDESELHLTPRDFIYASPSEADFEVYIEPSVTVELYDLPCCSFGWAPFVFVTEQDIGFPVLSWAVLGGFKSYARFEPGVADLRVVGYEPSLPTRLSIFAGGPFHTDDYVFIGEWGGEGSGDGQFGYPKGIAVDGGSVYVVDNWNNRVDKFSPDGRFLMRWGTSGGGEGQFNSPTGIAFDESGNIYVVDSGNYRIQKFAPDSTFITAWGTEGDGDGQFRFPSGIAIYGSDCYVADNQNNRVQRFSLDGAFIEAWGGFGSGDAQFDSPMGVAADPLDGLIFVTDCHNDRVQVFLPDGTFVRSWGSPGVGDSQFDCPVDATFASGALWVADIGNDRVVKFEPTGMFVTTLGSSGTGEGHFDHPEGVAVDELGNLYVVDGRNRRIQKFAPHVRSEPAARRGAALGGGAPCTGRAPR
jgi:DNA-binding beta-propeller fold protein YncE